jgi:hypothetical protein
MALHSEIPIEQQIHVNDISKAGRRKVTHLFFILVFISI